MKAYVAVRAEGERLVRETRLGATFVRPFYVLGPGHRWPYAFLPLFWLWGDRRLYPVKLRDVVRALAEAVEQPPGGVRIIEAPDLSRASASPARPAATTAPAHPPR
jgi:uncharacterized protein YbjT (DUF2867 family)